jgi:plastocyanin
VTMTEYRFEPSRLRVPAGSAVTLVAVNQGRVNHSFTIVGARPRTDSGSLNSGWNRVLRFVAPEERGVYRFICTEEDHEDEGMAGELIVD